MHRSPTRTAGRGTSAPVSGSSSPSSCAVDSGRVVTPLRAFEAVWPDGAFGEAVRELEAVRAHLIGLEALTVGKSTPREDPVEADRDRADFDVLSGL